MDLLTVIRRLWLLKVAVVLAFIIAAAAAFLTRYTVQSSGVRAKQTSTSTSSLQVLVDTRYSSLAAATLPANADAITARTPLYADLAASLPVRRAITARAGLPPGSVNVTASTTETESPTGGAQSTSYNAAPVPHARDQVVLTADDILPVLDISASAPSASRAAHLVNATVTSLQDSVTALERSEKINGPSRMVLRPLGVARGTTVVSRVSLTKTVLVGIVVLIALLLLSLALDGLQRSRHRARTFESLA